MNNIAILENRIEKGPFGFSFLSWQGNNISFEESNIVMWTLVGATFFFLLLFVLVKDHLHSFYQRNEKRINIFLQIYAFLIIALTIFRIVILAVGEYPNLWELVPFHFCRFFVIVLSILILFKKFEQAKYVVFATLCGAIVGLLITDLKNNDYWAEKGGIKIGYDSYSFWDFFIIHISAALISQYLLLGRRFMISKWDVAITLVSLISFTTLLFMLDWGLSMLDNEAWSANWFYFAPDHVNGIDDTLSKFLGPVAQWPWIFFLFLLIGFILYFFALLFYFLLDGIEINFKSKPIFKRRKSELYAYFKKGFCI